MSLSETIPTNSLLLRTGRREILFFLSNFNASLRLWSLSMVIKVVDIKFLICIGLPPNICL